MKFINLYIILSKKTRLYIHEDGNKLFEDNIENMSSEQLNDFAKCNVLNIIPVSYNLLEIQLQHIDYNKVSSI